MEFTSTKLRLSVIDAFKLAQIIEDGSEYHLIGAPQLPRKDYEQFAAVVTALRGRWHRQRHRFNYDPSSRLAEVLQVGMMPQSNPLAFFPTPDSVLDVLPIVGDYGFHYKGEWSINFPRNLDMLEPSAGDGAIAKYFRDKFGDTGLQIDCCELDPFNREILATSGFNLIGDDFLKFETDKRYDLIAMNPPFKGNTWLKHLLRAYEVLKVGGQILCVAPQSLFSGDSKLHGEVMNLVGLYGSIEPLDSGTFREQGTDVETCILQIKKPHQDLIDYWNTTEAGNGYPSAHCLAVMVALSCDRRFSDQKRQVKTQDQLVELIDSTVRRIQDGQYYEYLVKRDPKTKKLVSLPPELKKDGPKCCFYWTSDIQQQVLDAILGELAEDGIEISGSQQLALV